MNRGARRLRRDRRAWRWMHLLSFLPGLLVFLILRSGSI